MECGSNPRAPVLVKDQAMCSSHRLKVTELLFFTSKSAVGGYG